MDYSEDATFRGLRLEDSFLLGLRHFGVSLELEVEFQLTPDHPEWQSPLDGERACYRRGILRLADADRIVLKPSNLRPARDANGEWDFGNIDAMKCDGDRWSIDAEWGMMEITGGTLNIALN